MKEPVRCVALGSLLTQARRRPPFGVRALGKFGGLLAELAAPSHPSEWRDALPP
ncbi:MAG TPA: hypothetical protein VH062_20020 [Polyangiaceae bacterium]|nr:hypothetical protein [Polyangiaceae bacterium]